MPYHSARAVVQQCQGNSPAYFSVTNVLNSRLCRDWRSEKAPAQHPRAYCESISNVFGSGAEGIRNPALYICLLGSLQ